MNSQPALRSSLWVNLNMLRKTRTGTLRWCEEYLQPHQGSTKYWSYRLSCNSSSQEKSWRSMFVVFLLFIFMIEKSRARMHDKQWAVRAECVYRSTGTRVSFRLCWNELDYVCFWLAESQIRFNKKRTPITRRSQPSLMVNSYFCPFEDVRSDFYSSYSIEFGEGSCCTVCRYSPMRAFTFRPSRISRLWRCVGNTKRWFQQPQWKLRRSQLRQSWRIDPLGALRP